MWFGRRDELPASAGEDRRQGVGMGGSSTIANMRRGVASMFAGESRIGRRSTIPVEEMRVPESPKTPRLVLGFQNFSSTRLAIPYLNRPSMSLPSSPTITTTESTANSNPTTRTPSSYSTQPARTRALRPQPQQVSLRRENIGVDPADGRLAELAEVGRRRRKGKSRQQRQRCSPKFKNKRIRAKALTCMISGLILILVLTIYLGLALRNRQDSQEFHVFLILIILVTTIFFCHALIRLCMLLLHPPEEQEDLERQNLPMVLGPGGYATPAVPIRVVLARDEEAVGAEHAATKAPPPVYGLWRNSVRVDPNRLYWQRNTESNRRQAPEDRPNTATRPPSYISEDGVNYVVNAVPRSTAPNEDVQLPVHPSELGRVRGSSR